MLQPVGFGPCKDETNSLKPTPLVATHLYLAGRNFVPIRKKLQQLSAHIPPAKPSPQNAERKGIFHAVFKNTCGRSVRFKCVRMLPVCKRPGNLNIGKVTAFFEVLMFRNPAATEWPSPKLQHHARPPFDSAGFFNYFHVFPGRREPLERPRQGVPRIHVAGRSANSRTAYKCFRFHYLLRARNSGPLLRPHLAASLRVLKKAQSRRDAGATKTFSATGPFRKQLSPRPHEFQAMSADRLYNIPLHRTGLEDHPISRVAVPDEDTRVQSDSYDTQILKRRTWPIYLTPYRFAESRYKIALSFPRCASIPARMVSRAIGI